MGSVLSFAAFIEVCGVLKTAGFTNNVLSSCMTHADADCPCPVTIVSTRGLDSASALRLTAPVSVEIAQRLVEGVLLSHFLTRKCGGPLSLTTTTVPNIAGAPEDLIHVQMGSKSSGSHASLLWCLADLFVLLKGSE